MIFAINRNYVALKKSMKIAVITAAMIFAGHSLFAQVTIAPEAGLNIASMSYKSDKEQYINEKYSSRLGMNFGVYLNVPLVSGLFFQPGVLYSGKGYKMSETETNSGITSAYQETFSTNYIEVPLNLGYEYKLGKAGTVFATAGPYLGYGIGGKIKNEVTIEGVSATIPNNGISAFGKSADGAILKPLDFGLNFSLGYKLPFGLYARFQYGLGLSNIANAANVSSKNKCMSVGVGYAFSIK